MKYAIVESGGKQYKAVEGESISVDRLPGEPGDELSLEQVLMLVAMSRQGCGPMATAKGMGFPRSSYFL